MKEILQIVKRMIAEQQVLPEQLLSASDCDELLNARDGDEDFEAHWLKAHAEINSRVGIVKVDDELHRLAEDIRKESFLAVSRATGQHELASYVSDDFGLIAAAVMADYEDPWVNGLWMAYKNRGLPKPPIAEHTGKLSELISEDASGRN